MSLSRSALSLLVLSVVTGCSPFRAEVAEFRDGIEAFEEGRYPEAEAKFDEALESEPSSEAHFGKGASLYRQGRHEEATEQFQRSTGSRDEKLVGRSYLNLGNTRASAGDLDGAIAAYRRTLERDPWDHDARYNLEWALRAREQQQQQKGDDPQDGGESGEQDERADGGDDKEKGDDEGDGEREKQASGGDDSREDGSPQDEGGDQEADSGDQQEQQAGNPGEDEQESPSAGEEPGEQEDQGRQEERQAQGGPGQQPEQEPAQERPARAVSRQEAGEVLDALQASEQPLQPWKFQATEKRDRGGVEKDW